MDEDSENAPNQTSSSSGSAGTAVSDGYRKVGVEHPKYVEREHDELLAAEETKRKAGGDEEEHGRDEVFQENRTRSEAEHGVEDDGS